MLTNWGIEVTIFWQEHVYRGVREALWWRGGELGLEAIIVREVRRV